MGDAAVAEHGVEDREGVDVEEHGLQSLLLLLLVLFLLFLFRLLLLVGFVVAAVAVAVEVEEAHAFEEHKNVVVQAGLVHCMGVGGWVGGWVGRGRAGGLNDLLYCLGGWVVGGWVDYVPR